MDVQWYPGHMTKAKRMMQEDMKLVDLVIELVDARIPRSSRNPDIHALAANKSRMMILNKADLADASVSQKWKQYLETQGIYAVMMDARNRKGMGAVAEGVLKVCEKKFERDRKRGIKNRPVRAMIVGIPNVGKSTFINSYVKKACAKTGNRPGVTKGRQWIKLNQSVELLDTPGILWPKFEDREVGLHLALTGSIRDEVLRIEDLSIALVDFLLRAYPGTLDGRYPVSEAIYRKKLENTGEERLREAVCYQVLQKIAEARCFLIKGGEPDVEKAARTVLDEFRSGAFGRISLECPPY